MCKHILQTKTKRVRFTRPHGSNGIFENSRLPNSRSGCNADWLRGCRVGYWLRPRVNNVRHANRLERDRVLFSEIHFEVYMDRENKHHTVRERNGRWGSKFVSHPLSGKRVTQRSSAENKKIKRKNPI